MKKFIVSLLVGLSLLSTAHAVTVINNNKHAIDVVIYNGLCAIQYAEYKYVGKGDTVQWTRSALIDPDTVCVQAIGTTSSTGSFSGRVNNKSCTLEVVDAGFMQGVKIKKKEGC